ncbi:MAG: 4-(cytidine 5'-diphospho)-2-C-methyl-D-erythritol kinase [Candidatus Omnitrophica bacterium]|nr:4-(cytidine 5'-diphospho)-2-C-methyl-D-erythritol kinase [Candidatus Omnitrophota bacterium]
MVLNSYAKLNLYLRVLSRRKDNYHSLKTVFERIDLHDKIILKPIASDRIKITADTKLIPADESNLAFAAAGLLKNKFRIRSGVDIKIIKRIPVAGGMGGGSSNAVCVLCALNKLWKLGLGKKELVMLGRRLGADVPFFIHNTSFAKAGGRGDDVRPLSQLRKSRFWHIIAVPGIRASTPLVYQKWDKIGQKVRLTSADSDVKMLTSALRKKNISLISKILFNSLEEPSIKLYPEIGKIKEKLSSLGLKAVLMSGSGAAVFGMVCSKSEAFSLARQLRRNRTWRICIARTI